ncbi:diacylglycerol kinase alpha [Corvus hawaiiensis]|uniref:diacylglycerol kinase alpha n=1 Tax=Corvus hawaiiensis TaxID=134902 RepID=UPI0020187462|nr:diacylglycerol kinase alpha [Corvus hawaiiensis]
MEPPQPWAPLSPSDFAELQKYLDYSPRRVQDVLQDFSDLPESLDFEGFSLFLRRFLGAEGVPGGLQRRLFGSFQGQNGSGRVSLSDVSCALALLERGRPEDKLEFAFRLYDKDGNGALDSAELDRIVAQMMRVAQYRDWDVTELRPILQEMMRDVDRDGSGTVTLREWLRGGGTSAPLLALLGLDGDLEEDGRHRWALAQFSRPAFCGVCEGLLVGLRKQGLRCSRECGVGNSMGSGLGSGMGSGMAAGTGPEVFL